jgi:TPR repeat protein
LDIAELDNKSDIAELLRRRGAKTHTVDIIAKRLLKEAQEKLETNPSAENYVNLALVYEEKMRDYNLALENYQKGISFAEKERWVFHHMANCYEQIGRLDESITHYQKSIAGAHRHRDLKNSYKRLGLIYASGKGVEKNLPKAVEMLRRAAELHDHDAQYKLGIILEKGDGIERDYEEAVMWLRKASNAGHKPAIEKMAQLNEGPNPHDDAPCQDVDPNQVEVPEDFHIVYEEGPTHAEWGPHSIVEVYADGKCAKKEKRFSRADMKETTKIISEGRMSADAVKRIYAKVIGCGFFKMEKAYWNRDVRDGKRELIRITANGKGHSVVVYYYDVQRFNSLRGSLKGEVYNATK